MWGITLSDSRRLQQADPVPSRAELVRKSLRELETGKSSINSNSRFGISSLIRSLTNFAISSKNSGEGECEFFNFKNALKQASDPKHFFEITPASLISGCRKRTLSISGAPVNNWPISDEMIDTTKIIEIAVFILERQVTR